MRQMSTPSSSSADESLFDVVVLGGGDPSDELAQAHGVAVRPLIELAGQPMAWHVLRSLRNSGRVRHLVYVGPVLPAMEEFIDVVVPPQGALLANLEAGLAALPSGEGRVLVSTADVPMMRPEHVRRLMSRADERPLAGLLYPVVGEDICSKRFPTVRRTYVRVKDGTFTGGNLFFVRRQDLPAMLPRLQDAFDARKKPLKLGALIGIDVLFGLLTRSITVSRLEQAVSRLIGAPAFAILAEDAEIGTDVDKPSDLEIARAEVVLRN